MQFLHTLHFRHFETYEVLSAFKFQRILSGCRRGSVPVHIAKIEFEVHVFQILKILSFYVRQCQGLPANLRIEFCMFLLRKYWTSVKLDPNAQKVPNHRQRVFQPFCWFGKIWSKNCKLTATTKQFGWHPGILKTVSTTSHVRYYVSEVIGVYSIIEQVQGRFKISISCRPRQHNNIT